MKKLSKILCAVLMLALICTSLAFLVSADNTPDTVEKTTQYVHINAATVSPIEGNSLSPDGSGNFIQYQQRTDPNGDGKYNDGVATDKNQLDAWIVTPNGEDPYVTFWAGEFQNGGSSWNFQNTYSYNGPILTLDSYYVVDLDIATASELITSIAISLPNRNVVGEWESYGGFPFGTNVDIKNYVPDLGAEWTHFTVVCSMKTNKQHIFVNGQYLGTTAGVAYNASQVDAAKTLRANGIKIEVAYEDTPSNTKMIYRNESISFDNVARRDIIDAEGIAVLDAIFAAETPDITTWEGYPTNVRTGSLPAYVEIDGVQYNDLGEVYTILHGNTDAPKQVKLLNNFPVLWVRCDAVIDMNGYSCEIYSTEGSTETGDDIVTVDVPHIETLSYVQSGDSATCANNTKYGIAGNVWNSTNCVYFNGLDDTKADKGGPLMGASLGYVTNNLTDEVMGMVGPGQKGSNSYISVTVNDVVKKGDGNLYYVFDMDVAMLSEANTFGWYAVCRGTSGCFGTNVKTADFTASVNATEIGEFNHYTTVLDFVNNMAYTFLNGKLVSAVSGGVYGSQAAQYEAGFKFEQVRLFSSNEDTFYFDNVAVRKGTDNDGIAAAIAAGDISLWSGYYADDAGYTMPTAPVLAKVDGEAIYTAADLSAKLNGKSVKNVELYASLAEEIVVNCSAVVKTNGVNVDNLKVGEGVTKTVDGNTITFTAPWVPSATEAEVSSADFIIDKSVAGNLYTGRTGIKLINNNNNHLSLYEVTDADTGDTYLKINVNYSGYTLTNIYLGTEILPAPGNTTDASVMKDGEGYYVHDFDLATDGDIINGMTFGHIARNNASEDGTYPFGVSGSFGWYGLETTGNWVHVTIVGDLAANEEYLFINGEFVRKTGYANQHAGKHEYLNVKGSRFNLSKEIWLEEGQSILVDNLSVRVYKSSSELAAAVAAKSLDNWAGKVAGLEGVQLPAIATIDGVSYSGAKAASAALTGDKDVTVTLERNIPAKILIDCSATVITNGLDTVTIAPKTTVIDGNVVAEDIIKQGNRYIKLNADNVADYTVPVYWYESADAADPTEVIYFPVGSTVGYIGNKITVHQNLIINGVLKNGGWCDGILADDVYVTEWPTITADDIAGGTELYYYILNEEVATDITIKGDMKYNLSLYADFDVNVFLKDADGEYTIDGVKYTKITKGIAANNLASDITFDVEFVVEGVTYTERITVNVLTYAETVLNKADVSHQMKRVMMAALDYANEAYAFVGGSTNAQIEAILNNPAYAEYVVEANTEYGPANQYDLSGLISSVQLKIDSEVAFVIKVANGFTGEIVIEYADYKGQVWSTPYTVEEGQQYIVLEDLKVYNLDAIFTISGNGISGQYNLGQYIKHLVENNIDADFAEALFTYAKVAQAYKAALAAAQ